MASFGQANPLHILSMSIVYWLIVWPYLIFTGMQMVMGKENVVSLLFGNRASENK
jgi:hypothetical protein